MKTQNQLTCLVCLFAFLTIKSPSAYSQNVTSSFSDNIEIYSVKNKYPAKFGFIDRSNNNILIYPMYDSVRNFNNGLAAVKFQGYWGFINLQGNTIGEINYEKVTDFHDSIAGVMKNGLWQLINTNGNPISNQKFQNVGHLNSGLINVKSLTSGWGYIDKNGKPMSQFKYKYATYFIDGLAVVGVENDMQVINSKFETICNDTTVLVNIANFCESAEPYGRQVWCEPYVSHTPCNLRKVGRILLINEVFWYVIGEKSIRYNPNYCVGDNFICVQIKDTDNLFYSTSVKSGTIQIPEKWGGFKMIANGNLLILVGSETIVINTTTLESFKLYQKISSIDVSNSQIWQIMLEESYEGNSPKLFYNSATGKYIDSTKVFFANSFCDGFAVFKMKNWDSYKYTFGYVSTQGRILGNQSEYSYASDFIDGRAQVSLANQFLLIDTNSNQIGEIYSDLERINSKLFSAKINGKSFLMDLNGNQLSKKQYDYVDNEIYDELILVQSNGLWGYIDTVGNEVIPPKYKSAAGFSNGEAIVGYEDKTSNCDNRYCAYYYKIDKMGNRISEMKDSWFEYTPN